MWSLTNRERKIFNKVVPDQFMSQLVQCPNGEEASIEEFIKRKSISAVQLEAIYKTLPKDVKFYEFLDKLRPVRSILLEEELELSDKQKKIKKEYKERIQKLKNNQANLEYDEMIKSIDLTRNKPLLNNIGQEMREMNKQMMAVTNTLITVGGAFAFGFWGIQFAYPHLKLDIAERMLMGLVFGTIVFFADLYFIVKGMDRDEGKS